jgi:hypothetical protein
MWGFLQNSSPLRGCIVLASERSLWTVSNLLTGAIVLAVVAAVAFIVYMRYRQQHHKK